MKGSANPEIDSIISRIQETEEMIKMWEECLPDVVAASNVRQFEDLKKRFIKQLFAAVVEAEVNVSDIEPFIQNATSYLKKFDRSERLNGDLRANLAEVERMMA